MEKEYGISPERDNRREALKPLKKWRTILSLSWNINQTFRIYREHTSGTAEKVEKCILSAET